MKISLDAVQERPWLLAPTTTLGTWTAPKKVFGEEGLWSRFGVYSRF